MVLSAREAAFRAEVRQFLDQALTEDLRAAGRRCSGIFSDYPDGIRWHRILAQRGWSVPHWPPEHGGTGWSPMQHYLFASELAAADAPALAPMGTHMVAPVIIAFGTPEQQRRWLPGIRSGDDYWAQGYSEPQAGSDLASLQCRARREGDHYIVNGSKIWTTHAQYANRMFMLVRTASGGKPQQGISFLCLDLHSPGVTVRPIVSISGDHEFNQVFFDDVRVPVDGLIGDENAGWTIAKFLLANERGGAWTPRLRGRWRRLRRAHAAAFAGRPGDEAERRDLQRKLAELACRIDAVQALEMTALGAHTRGEPPGIRPSVGKVLGSELRQALTELELEIGGPHAQARVPLEHCGDGPLALPEDAVFAMSAYLNDRAASIYAGTNEVQRNLIAARLLGGAAFVEAAPLTDTQRMLNDSLERYLSEQTDVQSRARALAAAPAAPPLWQDLARTLGLPGAAFTEEEGGQGGGFADHLPILETLGRHLAGEPYLSAIVSAGGLLRRCPAAAARERLARLLDGSALIVVADTEPDSRHDPLAPRCTLTPWGSGWRLDGRKSLVHGAPWADEAIVTARIAGVPEAAALALVAVPLSGTRGLLRRDLRTVDGGWASELRFDAVEIAADQRLDAPGNAAALIAQVHDETTLAMCAEAIGVLDRLLADTTAYARERRQFGVPIASFQVLQHRIADMYLALEPARALARASASWVDAPPPERERGVSAVLVAVARACRVVGQGAVQIHGGMGMTEELAVGHFFRRATQIEQRCGSTGHHLRRVAALLDQTDA